MKRSARSGPPTPSGDPGEVSIRSVTPARPPTPPRQPPAPGREPRVVVDPLGNASLTAQPAALDHDGVDALTCGIDCGGEPGGAATDDREVVAPALGLEREPELARQLLVGRLDEHVGPVKDDRRNRAASLLQLLDVLQGGGIVVDVHPLVGDALLRPI